MKIKKYLMAVLVVLAAALQSCEKDVANFDISTTPMLVTTGFISPQDTALAVEVKYLQPAIGVHRSEEELKVKNATVTISDGTQTVQLTYDPVWSKYFASTSTFPVVANKSYYLKVTTPAGETVEAMCTVPSKDGVNVTELNYSSVEKDSYGYPMTQHNVDFKWQDKAGVENYYHVTSYRAYSYYDHYVYPPIVTTQYEPIYTDNKKALIRDENQDGKILQSPLFSLSTGSPDHATKPFKIVAIVSVTDQAYYLYHQSIFNQESVDGNPFAEPKRIYSNVQGGVGVFAAYNQIKVQKTIQ